jgi:hypothetical protein
VAVQEEQQRRADLPPDRRPTAAISNAPPVPSTPTASARPATTAPPGRLPPSSENGTSAGTRPTGRHPATEPTADPACPADRPGPADYADGRGPGTVSSCSRQAAGRRAPGPPRSRLGSSGRSSRHNCTHQLPVPSSHPHTLRPCQPSSKNPNGPGFLIPTPLHQRSRPRGGRCGDRVRQ